MKILITGGLGYIGSNLCSILLEETDHTLFIIDNLYNSYKKVFIELKNFKKKQNIIFKNIDIRDNNKIDNIFKNNNFDLVIHLAGLKSIFESKKKPLIYNDVNLNGAKNIIDSMVKYGVKKIIFSSSAAVYGLPKKIPVDENHPTNPLSVYSSNKLEIEKYIHSRILDRSIDSAVILRYFNPVGSDRNLKFGENPKLPPENLFQNILHSIFHKNLKLKIYGSGLNTNDGFAVRDFIHIHDLCTAHLSAIKFLENNNNFHIFNIGTGIGISVKDILMNFNDLANFPIYYEIYKLRDNEVPVIYCDPKKANITLKWKASSDIKQMVSDSYEFFKKSFYS